MGEIGLDQQPGAAKRWRTMSVATGIAGLAALVLVIVSQSLLLAGETEPDFDAPAAEILHFLEAQNETLYAAGSYLSLLALMTMAWFVAGLSAVLRQAEGDPAWRSAVALASGIVFVALVMTGGWQVGQFRLDDGLDPQLARFAFDLGNLGFANSWIALGSFMLAAGWIIVDSRSLPAWLGWWALVAGVGFLIARAVWLSPVWLIPYALFWVWVVVVCVQLVRRRIDITRA
ncbi:uncharacterized protein DUF4386 [Kribbella sp. VKM Ac-2527]|uniref:Uncharacterized protein DUF4386 n=1 Tax=Kribbella caucasensis TaxID=2512215 RepID=A0A4R6KCQ0_9ACTN|nr:DUF4386 family protein [Kribbella sp. VKM Ac-2527]TDO47923.1 uncharacterized protein DUF4386 [Kribbella sp. VKM Ac-2527]